MAEQDHEVRMALQQGLLRWYPTVARKLPWRGTQDPYAIFLSEIILQQTRVAQGLPYYERFLDAYPTVEALAAAPEDDVLRLWQGLGYYSRARNMLAAARQVAAEGWPRTAAGLAVLPGIGPYTAAAIASFAFGEAVPVLDGNVARVLSRWFDLDGDILKPATQAQMRGLAAQILLGAPPATFNQAMMEFGALQCVPGQPLCMLCPVQDLCLALAHGTVTERPVKAKAKAKRERHLLYLAVQDSESRLLVRRREGKGIWQGLYEFFHLEREGQAPTPAEGQAALAQLLGIPAHSPEWQPEAWRGTHVLSHQVLHLAVVPARLANPCPAPEGYRWVTRAEWEQLGKAVPMVKATEALGLR